VSLLTNEIKTIIALDRDNTLEITGRPRNGRGVFVKLTHVVGRTDDNIVESTVTDFKLSDETLRGLIHVLEGYR